MKNVESKSNESLPRLGNFKKILTRDEMKKAMGGGYTVICGAKFCIGDQKCVNGRCQSQDIFPVLPGNASNWGPNRGK